MSKSLTAKKSKPARRGKSKFSSNAEKGPGPHSKKGEGQKNQ
jgi:hypothetical protein